MATGPVERFHQIRFLANGTLAFHTLHGAIKSGSLYDRSVPNVRRLFYLPVKEKNRKVS